MIRDETRGVKPQNLEAERVKGLAVADIRHKVNMISGMKRELKSWERRQDTCSADYSEQVEKLESDIEQIESEIEAIEQKYL